ncbi:MAG TPA: isocitrate dehydrogenase (NADP(+)) [Candidatus Lokiarchaeia archaeon]|nr:isocitrate dehydrogenase (NADP(+)) [Candidatus Lokiarchaeia archaeon]
MDFDKLELPTTGHSIRCDGDQLIVPEDPIIPYIQGDGIGPDITKAMLRVVDEAVKQAYGGARSIQWLEIFAGKAAMERYGEYLPNDTLAAIEQFIVAIKGPLATPVSGGIRSINVALRQKLNLYACVRPYQDYGAPSPVKHPEDVNFVIFRENTEDVYAGYEWPNTSPEAARMREILEEEFAIKLGPDTGIGIKPISEHASKNIVRAAIKYAVDHQIQTVTLMHKGNIEKFTEGAFKTWGYAVATEEFRDQVITAEELKGEYGGEMPEGKILVNDLMADDMFEEILVRPRDFHVIVTTNLNGDYISDASAAQIGGLGIAPGANFGNIIALFESTHGTAPDIANQDKANPSALILSAALMLEHIGWPEAATLIKDAIRKTIHQKKVTTDFARLMEGEVEALTTTEYATAVIDNLGN